MGEPEGGGRIVCAGCYDYEQLSSAFRFTHERSPMTGRYYTHRKATWNPDSESSCERSHVMTRRNGSTSSSRCTARTGSKRKSSCIRGPSTGYWAQWILRRFGPEGFESADDERVVFWWSVRGTWDPLILIEDSDAFGREDRSPAFHEGRNPGARLDELKSDRGGASMCETHELGNAYIWRVERKGSKRKYLDIRGPGPSSG